MRKFIFAAILQGKFIRTALDLITTDNFARTGQNNVANAKRKRSVKSMSNKQAKEALERFKQEAANEVGVNLKNGYNGDLTSRQAGSIGGQMVKKMIESYENTMK